MRVNKRVLRGDENRGSERQTQKQQTIATEGGRQQSQVDQLELNFIAKVGSDRGQAR